jgi:hypothetical protein
MGAAAAWAFRWSYQAIETKKGAVEKEQIKNYLFQAYLLSRFLNADLFCTFSDREVILSADNPRFEGRLPPPLRLERARWKWENRAAAGLTLIFYHTGAISPAGHLEVETNGEKTIFSIPEIFQVG